MTGKRFLEPPMNAAAYRLGSRAAGAVCGWLGLMTFWAAVVNAAEKPPLRYVPMSVANGCFVESVVFYDTVLETFGAEAWCRVLQWGAKEDEEIVAGHAVAVFEQRGQLWCWDMNRGFSALSVEPALREEVEKVAAPVLAKYPRISAYFPTYRYDFAQTPDPAPPDESRAVVQTDLVFRDALLAGARLAKHRPVNVVQFSFVADGETRQSAATVFIFHGRLCIYFPERGTVPFRSRMLSVQNLRLIQEAIRQQYRGAQSVKPL
jgi:hypothetical protein